jgi:hypothetical protein
MSDQEFDPTEGGVEVARITIRKTVTDNDVIVSVSAEDDQGEQLGVLDAAGMVAFAMDCILHPPEDEQ